MSGLLGKIERQLEQKAMEKMGPVLNELEKLEKEIKRLNKNIQTLNKNIEKLLEAVKGAK